MLQNIMHTKVIAFSDLFYVNTNVKFHISLVLVFAVVLMVAVVIISGHISFAFLCILESVLIFSVYM